MAPKKLTEDPDLPYTDAKKAVLLAAAWVIRERGPRSATLKNIANRVKITEPAIFRHFEGVVGLFTELFHTVERIYARINQGFDAELSGWERLKPAMISMVDILADGNDLAYIILYARQVFGGYPDLRERLGELEAESQGRVLACIQESIERKEMRNDISPETVAAMLSGMANSTVAQWIVSGFSFDLKTTFRTRMDEIEKLILLPGKEKKVSARRKPKAS
jgi:AcrR family transcriptional regulator